MKLKRRNFLQLSSMAFLSSQVPSFAAAKKKQPNILFIMADDHSVNAVNCYDSWLNGFVQTPNIDRLAKEGVKLTNCVNVNSLCAPSRASILMGQYSHKTGVYTLREDLNTRGKKTLSTSMKAAGYQNAVFGKWHIHGDNMYGFDDWAVTNNQGAYFNPSLGSKSGEKVRRQGYTTDCYTDLCLEWLQKRDKNEPFFLMCHHKAAHGPWQFAPRHKDMYKGVEIPEPPTFWDDFKNRSEKGSGVKKATIYPDLALRMTGKIKSKSGDWPTGTLNFEGKDEKYQKKATFQKYIKDYLRCVKGLDESVGRFYEYLKTEGILDDTVVIYTSDQGMYIGEHGYYDKRLGLEEGLLMPFVARFPSEIKAGTVSDAIVNNVDFPETLLDYAGGEIPDTMQGISFRQILQGKLPVNRRRSSFYAFYSNGTPRQHGIRTERYKLLIYSESGGKDLFDLKNDPNELRNEYNNPEYASVVKTVEAELAKVIKEVDIKPNQLPGALPKKKKEKQPKKKKAKKKKTREQG